jgi:putative endonuclease
MYILKCSDGSYYTGSTWNLEKRLAEHQTGMGAKHTRKRLPVTLIYCEECERVEDAYQREKQIQGWSRKKKEALIKGDTNALHRLAECQNDTHYSAFSPPSASPEQPTLPKTTVRSLSEVEGSEVEGSEVEGSEVEGSEVEGSEVEGSEVEGGDTTRSLSEAEGNKSEPSK